jgi:prepilin-type N-terminal cleavage/methylation domain-containing protein
MTLILQRSNQRQRGFTLVELALVVGIVALMLGGLMVPLSRSLEQKALATTQARLEVAQQALVGYVLINNRLPCPDTGNMGLAGDNATATGCATWTDTTGATPDVPGGPTAGSSWGRLPWATLGIDGVDGWGNRLDYAVYTPLVSSSSFSTSVTDSNLVVRCTGMAQSDLRNNGDIPGCLIANVAVIPSTKTSFVVYSHGKNGLGAVLPDGTGNPLPITLDELQNRPSGEATADLRRTFVSRSRTDDSSNAYEFDDIMVWMPSTLLTAKLFAAGKWP